MPSFSTTAINKNLKAAVVVAGFCINQLSAFPLPALRFILGNILNIAVILFYFFLNSIFSYKTPHSAHNNTNTRSVHGTFLLLPIEHKKRERKRKRESLEPGL